MTTYSQLEDQAALDQHDPPQECPGCHFHNVTDDWFFVCVHCGWEGCPDCAGRCGCPLDDDDT